MRWISFLLIFTYVLLSHVQSSEFNWKCEVSNSSNSKCYRSFDGNKLNSSIGTSTSMVYVGEVSNNLPNGKGEIIFNQKKINNNYERSVNSGLLQKKAKGIFKTNSNQVTKLTDGKMEYMSGVIETRKNKKTIKVSYPDGETFSGKFFLDDEYGYPVLSKGTFEHPTRKDGWVVKFVGEFYFSKSQEKRTIIHRFKKGLAYYANGDTFDGLWHYEKVSEIKKGTYRFKNGEKFIGEFNEKGRYLSGKFFYKNGDIYEGTFFQSKNGDRKTGTYLYADGGKLKINNGKEGKYKPSKKLVSKSSKSYEPGFFASFILSWVFTGLLWGLIFLYFYFLHQFGKVVKKIPIKGVKETATFIGFGLTWYLAWAFLYGFGPAALINFTFIIVGIWGGIGLYVMQFLLKILPKKNLSNYFFIGFVIFWILLGVGSIDIPIKILKNIF